MAFNGIDVSEIQGNINWKNVSLSNIDFAMIRATYGSSGVDDQFINNMNNIKDTDIAVGVYHQSNAQNVNDVTAEAYHFLETIRPYKFSYPLALNIESEIAMNIGKEFFTNIISSFFEILKKSGYDILLYASQEMIDNYIDMSRLEDVKIWLADLTSNVSERLPLDPNVAIWQYSNRGVIRGISGNVNLDISYINSSKININGSSGANADTINSRDSDTDSMFYTVQNGDTLRDIAKKVYGSEDDYQKLMDLNGITRPVIFAGQTLRIPNIGRGGRDALLYRVKSGDTLWGIARQYLGGGPRYKEILDANGLTNDMIYPGQILKIPAENAGDVNSNLGEKEYQTYMVKQGDTLWKIAQNLFGDGNKYSEIMNLNNLPNGNLRVGQILKIPKK
ncbi:MAG: LysM peptidoglycan-binding domain-containing protein [Clostridia bacterium]|nr:LysM peptidoglycan-binding domain-containing protein [Clostridia bacterium]